MNLKSFTKSLILFIDKNRVFLLNKAFIKNCITETYKAIFLMPIYYESINVIQIQVYPSLIKYHTEP